MTSTPRSTLPWRTSPKSRAPTSLSLVVAEPQLGSPLASAVTRLPPIKMSSDGDVKTPSATIQDPESQTDVETRSHPDHNDELQPEQVQPNLSSSTTDDIGGPPACDPNVTEPSPGPCGPKPAPQPRSWLASLSPRGSSNVPLNELAKQTPTGEQATAVETAHSTTAAAAPPPDERPDTVPASLPVSDSQANGAVWPEADIVSQPSKRSWFASSLSSKRPSKLRHEPPPSMEPAPTDPPISETPQYPVTNVIPPTPPNPELTRVESRPPSKLASVSITQWFSPVLSSQPRSLEAGVSAASPSGSQAGVDPLHTPSSIDEQVPKLPSACPPLESISPPAILSIDTTLSSLNPSASRFSLSIPFLGRSKVSLDSAIASAKGTDIPTEPETDGGSSTPLKDISTTGMEEPTVKTAENAPTDYTSPPGPANSDSALQAQGSWWGLVGWGSATTHTVPQQAQHSPQIRLPDQETAAVTVDVVANNTPSSGSSVPAQEARPESTLSPEATQGRGSSWLSPWSWYGQPTYAPEVAQRKEGGANHIGVLGELAAERAKEAPTHETASTTHVEPTNPIQSSITANVSGWTSFLSSRSMLAKRIADTEHRVEDTMEVMDIDDGDEERSSTVALVATSEIRAGKDVVARDPQGTTPAPPRSPSPSPKPKAKPGKLDDQKGTTRTSVSPTPSRGSGRASPRIPPAPNLVLPTWEDTFCVPPRSTEPRTPTDSALAKTVRFVSSMLFTKDDGTATGKDKAHSRDDSGVADFGRELPRTWDAIGESLDDHVLRGCKRVVVIGIHGWFPGAVTRTMLGEPTGTSSKFVTMMRQALEVFQEQHKVRFDKVTQIPLEGEGTIGKRVEKLYNNLTANSEWMDDLHGADAILIATHSQGCIVSAHLVDLLIRDRHIKTLRTLDLLAAAFAPGGTSPPAPSAQRVCCLALCGIHLGPLRYLSSSSLLQPYIQYFESAAAKELFEFQNTSSEVSKSYVKALRNVVDHGVKMVYIASLNDQVVPLYSGLFTAASHPLILRALYIDGDAYHSSDFLSNLLVLLLRVMNVGLSDSGLLTHLSEATAGSLNGIGHSTAYEELATYSLAVNYLFMTNHGSNEHPELVVQPFDANTELNDYEIPWALRDLIANERVRHFFAGHFANLRNAFPDWHPKTAILRDIKRKLQPIQRLNTDLSMGSTPSKL